MLSAGMGRLSSKFVARLMHKRAMLDSRFSCRVGCPRFFSSTPVRRQTETAATAIAGAQTQAAGPPLGGVDLQGVEEYVGSIYAGDYLPHNTQIYTNYLAEQAEKVVDISADVSISQIAEGLSTDLLTASGVVPTLQDMGLGSYWTPPGLLQNALDMLHNAGLPWWVAIACTTVTLKILVFPLVLKAQRNSTSLNNHMPEMQRLQLKMTEARACGDALAAHRAAMELQNFTTEHNFNPITGVFPMLIQAPIFISFFVGLRGMANLPIESMKTGGMYWFTDLTVPDPYYILPLVTCTTVWIMLETGADGLMRADNMRKMKWAVRCVPVVFFPLIMNFPAAMLCYWTTSNFFALAQATLLRQPAMRKMFKVPPLVKHDKKALPASKGFVKEMKDSFTNARLSNEIANRARVDEVRFKKAGTGPVLKTFKHPQKLKQTANT